MSLANYWMPSDQRRRDSGQKSLAPDGAIAVDFITGMKKRKGTFRRDK
jgi:hypothetical protein